MVDPRHYLARERLKDGTEVTIRAIRASDGPAILAAFGELDRESVYRRFFSPKKELSDAELKQLTEVDFRRVTALVVTTQTHGVETLVGGGRYATDSKDHPHSGELAFLTAAPYRGRGIAGLLFRHLGMLAKEAGISRFEADVLGENQSMLNVFRRSGLLMTQRREGNAIHLTIELRKEDSA
jgi:GNAT superfamily N-acetyltransferase